MGNFLKGQDILGYVCVQVRIIVEARKESGGVIGRQCKGHTFPFSFSCLVYSSSLMWAPQTRALLKKCQN